MGGDKNEIFKGIIRATSFLDEIYPYKYPPEPADPSSPRISRLSSPR